MKNIFLRTDTSAIVDDCDYDDLNSYRWYLLNSTKHRSYAIRFILRNGRRKTIFMHRQILTTPDGFVTDHINGNGLDNRRCNIRICTIKENNRAFRRSIKAATSKFRGVSRFRNKWQTLIGVDGDIIYLGVFNCEIEAAKTYDKAAKKYFGEFADLNFKNV